MEPVAAAARTSSKPSLQTDPGCSNRTVADVSAVADPNTGVAVYSTYEGGWLIVGGTSASSPIVAAIFTAAGKTALGTTFPYTHTSAFYDVTTGSNGSCSPAYLCTGQVGFDGPTGWGTPNGQLIAASSDTAQVFSVTFNPASLEGGSTSTGTILLTALRPSRWRNGRADQQRPQRGYRSQQRRRSRWQPERDLPGHHGSDVYPDNRQYSGYLPGQHQRDGDADLACISDASVVGAFSRQAFPAERRRPGPSRSVVQRRLAVPTCLCRAAMSRSPLSQRR
jgi:hypothetical protein